LTPLAPNSREERRQPAITGKSPTLAIASDCRADGDPTAQMEGDAMADIDLDQLGPVDYMVVSFPADKADFSGAMANELKKLTDSGTVRVLDLMIVTKAEDGTVDVAELRDGDESEVGELLSLEADMSLLLAAEDVERAGADLAPGSTAAVLVWENTWAGPLASAIRHSGGELVSGGRIPNQALIAAAEEDRLAADAGA
jgi:hypothetical protein